MSGITEGNRTQLGQLNFIQSALLPYKLLTKKGNVSTKRTNTATKISCFPIYTLNCQPEKG